MSILNLGKACVFSTVTGVVTQNGQPLENAEIKRNVTWQKKDADQTRTDSNGRFSFPSIFHNSLMKYFPAEFVSHQTITIHHDGKQYLAWETTKRETEENSELGGKAINLSCELSNEPSVKYAGKRGIDGICTWE